MDLREYIDQLAHEKGITDQKREQETSMLLQVQRQELQSQDAAHRMDQEMIELQHDLEKTKLIKEEGRTEAEKDAESSAKIKNTEAKADVGARKLEHEQDMQEAQDAMDLSQKRKDQKSDHMAKMAKIFDGVKVETLMALIEDGQQRMIK